MLNRIFTMMRSMKSTGIAILLIVCLPAFGNAVENVILHFDQTHGAYPLGNLIADKSGNLYGTASGGGVISACLGGCGNVFELSPTQNGTWIEKVLYTFQGSSDGGTPNGTLIVDKNNNLYGTFIGDDGSPPGIFELTRGSNGSWSKKNIYLFSQGFVTPNGYLTIDAAGNIYGADQWGGSFGDGEVFELSPTVGGSWIETSIHSFSFSDGNGFDPFGGVIVDSKGNLYGTTLQGGASRAGTVFELSPQTNGQWTESLLYSFTLEDDGGSPESPLTFDASGNLYGTTYVGGIVTNAYGTVFKLTPNSNGSWSESLLYVFGGHPDGQNPTGPVVFDSHGNLYGAAFEGGGSCNVPGCGIVFQLQPQAQGLWTETILYEFASALQGSSPLAGVLLDEAHQRLFVTSEYGGGRFGYGTVTELKR